MSAVYLCQGTNCPLREQNPTGLAIIPNGEPRWRLSLKEVMAVGGTAEVDLCKDCAWAVREMVAR